MVYLIKWLALLISYRKELVSWWAAGMSLSTSDAYNHPPYLIHLASLPVWYKDKTMMQLKDVNWIRQWVSSTTKTSNVYNNAMLRNIAQLAFVPWPEPHSLWQPEMLLGFIFTFKLSLAKIVAPFSTIENISSSLNPESAKLYVPGRTSWAKSCYKTDKIVLAMLIGLKSSLLCEVLCQLLWDSIFLSTCRLTGAYLPKLKYLFTAF